ncbi:MAG: CvpA family protein [Oscillospiraceae bacterium]|jgi:uncharacterized membrane protein required for colicin V production|nr:CvpA family protein [Oscillospiraceae bacterium]
MSWIVDLIFVLLFAACVGAAARRGFLGTALSLAAWVVSALAAGLLSRSFAQPIYDAFVANGVREGIRQQIEAVGSVTAGQVQAAANNVAASLPAGLKALADFSGISVAGLLEGLRPSAGMTESAAQLIEQRIVEPLALVAIRWALCAVLFGVLLTATRFLASWVEKIGKLPGLRQANRLLGAALGALRGLLVVMILGLLCGAAAQLLPAESEIGQALAGSAAVRAVGSLFAARFG